MTQHTEFCPMDQRADVASGREALETALVDSGWRKFRIELDARIVERFGVAMQEAEGNDPDPAVLADLALLRALMF